MIRQNSTSNMISDGGIGLQQVTYTTSALVLMSKMHITVVTELKRLEVYIMKRTEEG